MLRLSTGFTLSLVPVGLVCASALLCGCKSTSGLEEDPRDETTAQAAASQFERDAYCPIDRVSARRIVPMPTPPTIIEVDPDRLALWEREWHLRATTDARLLIEVEGCNLRSVYSCWEMAHSVHPTGRARKTIVVGAVCLTENGYVSGQ